MIYGTGIPSSSAVSGGMLLPPKSIVNVFAKAGWAPVLAVLNGCDVNAGAKPILSGALVANILSTILNINSPGVFNYLSVSCIDITARTIRAVITIDGTIAYDYTSVAIASANAGAVIIGSNATNAGLPGEVIIPFDTSFKLEIASDLTEVDKINIGVKYRTC